MKQTHELVPDIDAEVMRPADVTVVLVDDHAIWRGGVRSMLEETEFRVIGEASSGKEAIELLNQLEAQIVLLDIRMSSGDGLDALQMIKATYPRTSVIMLTTYENPTYMVRAVAGGASGYLLKGVDFATLIASLRAVASGEMLLSSHDLTRSLRSIHAGAVNSDDLVEPVTRREREVLRLLATGISNREMASVLFIAESTVKSHVEHIIGKLGVSDRVQAAVWAAQHGILPSP